jgi:nucleotide-binding universal stress UspA family protein
LARTFKARLILMHVGYDATSYPDNEFPVDLDESLLIAERQQLLETLTPFERAELHPEFVLGAGNPAHEIVRCALERRVDVIVMGTHGRSGVSHVLLGSIAEKVVRTAPCPVLVIRQPIAEAPQVAVGAVAVEAH